MNQKHYLIFMLLITVPLAHELYSSKSLILFKYRNCQHIFLNFTLHLLGHTMQTATSNPVSSVHLWLHVSKTCIYWGKEVSREALQKPHRFPPRSIR